MLEARGLVKEIFTYSIRGHVEILVYDPTCPRT